MTKKEEIIEAIEILKNERRKYIVDGRERKLDRAIDVVIEALEEPTKAVTDCISRERAIEIVKRAETKEIAYLALINLEPKEIPTCDECRLPECLVDKQDGWIPFGDDGAAPNYEVMCQDRYGNMMLGYAWVDEQGIWVCEDDNIMMDDVVAWRPLPVPYKESDKE